MLLLGCSVSSSPWLVKEGGVRSIGVDGYELAQNERSTLLNSSMIASIQVRYTVIKYFQIGTEKKRNESPNQDRREDQNAFLAVMTTIST